MGTVIHLDFNKRVRLRTEYADDQAPQAAVIRTLTGQFRDDVLFAALPNGAAYRLLQFPRGAQAEVIPHLNAITHFTVTGDKLMNHFRALHEAVMVNPHRNDPVQRRRLASLFTRMASAVHIIEHEGVFRFGDNAPAHYPAGHAVIEFNTGATDSGPAQDVLKMIVPMDEDARIALAAALRSLPPPPPGFPPP